MAHSPDTTTTTIAVDATAAATNATSSSSSVCLTEQPVNNNGMFVLEFADFVDLQTRLVLHPREDDIGAVVANYIAGPNQNTAEPSQETRDDDSGEASFLRGCSLIGLETTAIANAATDNSNKKEELADDWRELEFATIWSLLRQEESKPLRLVFAATAAAETTPEQSVEQNEEQNASSPVQTTTSEATKEKPKPSSNNNVLTSQESLQVGMSVLSSWGMRMRAQATEAATSLSTVALERAKNFQTPKANDNQKENNKPCNVFIQTSVGAFVPVEVAQSKVTTSSLLLVRKSATEPSPKSGWGFQWYRSSFANESWEETASLTSSSRSGSSSSGDDMTPEVSAPATSTTEESIEWIALDGATTAAFQPDATLMGRKLRCIVTIMAPEEEHSSDDSSDHGLGDDDADLQSVQAGGQEVVIDLPGVVAADTTLFNAARQALARGAKFGGLKGRGNAQGRQFRIDVAIGMMPCHKKRSRRTTSSLMIYQMGGKNESVSLMTDDKPIFQVGARGSSSHPKHLDLKISVPPESVLSALCTDGVLQLEASNRLARESFLMTLGIANYTGEPAKLDAQTILFKDESSVVRSLMDDDASVSSGSCASSVRSHGSYHGPTINNKSVSSPSLGPLISPISSVQNTPGSPTTRSVSSAAALERAASPESLGNASTSFVQHNDEEENRVAALERELEFLRGKLARKDKVVSELQRQITHSDNAHEQTRQSLVQCQQDLQQSKATQERLSQSLQKAEGYIKSHEARTLRLEGEHAQKVSVLESRIESQSTKIAELEKANRALQNEKAVLQAAVEARESKLTRMAELQASFDELSTRVAQNDALRSELETARQRYQDIQLDLQKVEAMEKESRAELAAAQASMQELTTRMEKEREQAASCHAQFDTLQKKIQLLKGERNSFKQKNDSLSKEVARLCKNGRTIKDIEKILADHQSLLDETEALRQQKKKALEDAHQYRTSFQLSRAAHELSGTDVDTRAALERTAELERLLADLTEYVTAKEMQLETMKQVNEQLQLEIRTLAKANLDKNEV